jgi:serine/threonine-protein kinase
MLSAVTPVTAAPELAPGERFGPYFIEGRVGQGGMGAVYRATDSRLDRKVALKVIRPDDGGSTSADAIARFLREARVGASLAHPNIAVVFEAGAVGDVPYIAMEWIAGTSLAAVMRQRDGALSAEARLQILDAVGDALAHAHERGVIHRDVKPSNVMLDERGRARLVDFGVARHLQAPANGTAMFVTEPRALIGTPAYMAPEQLVSPAVDGRADQFAWGVMAYELLTGSHPRTTVPADGHAFPVATPASLVWLNPALPEALGAVVHRTISYAPDSRFGSMGELLRAFRATRSLGLATRAPTLPATAFEPTVPQVRPADATFTALVARGQLAPSLTAGSTARARRPWPLVVGAAVLSLAAAVLGAMLAPKGGAALAGAGASFTPRTASLEPLDELAFAGSPAEVRAATSALEAKLGPCVAGLPRGLMVSLDIFVAPDGGITRTADPMVCKRQFGEHYLCTDREGVRKPKQDHPAVTDDVFACVERAFVSSRLPRVTVASDETTSRQSVHVNVR